MRQTTVVSLAGRHFTSALSVTAIACNLTFWSVPLIIIVIVRTVVTNRSFRERCNRVVERIYRAAVRFDSWWLTRVLGIEIRVTTNPDMSRHRKWIVISNHRSWFDILVIQHVVSLRGPMLQFLIKRQLIWVPIVGWICLALNFPRLNRGRDERGREEDYRSIARASMNLGEAPGALLTFAEGTRFTDGKRRSTGSNYRHLLIPKAGGLRVMLENLGDVAILDLTLVYPGDDCSFWHCLSGSVGQVEVHVATANAATVTDIGAWLNERWQLKDDLIADSHKKRLHTDDKSD